MNRFFKYLSISIALSLLCVSAHTHSMHVKKLAKTSASYSLRQKNTTNKINSDQESANINISDLSTPQKKLKWEPLEDLDFTPATKLDFPPKKAEPWSSPEIINEISVDEAIYGIRELGNRHKAFIEEYGDKVDNSKTKWFNSFTSAWKQLGLHLCKNIPIARPDDGKPSDPKYTLRAGEEIKLTKAMCALMRDNKTPFEEQAHRANNENTDICTSKALMCVADPEQPQKKKRLLKDELKYPHGQEMGGDTLAYSVTVDELCAGLEEFGQQVQAHNDKCDRE